MSKVLTTDKLIKSVKRRAFMPTSQATFTDEDFLEILNEEIDTSLMPYVIEKHEEYMVYSVDLPKSDNNRYEIPYRAIANKLRDVCIVDTNSNIRELSRISLEDISDFQNTYGRMHNSVFYVENNEIVLLDTSLSSTDKIRMYFYMRPSSLVLMEDVGKITSIDFNSGIISVDNFPADFTSLPTMDFVGNKTPNKIKAWDIEPISVNQNAKFIVFDPSDLPESLLVGDYICFSEQSPVPQIPLELHPLLAQKAAIYCLESMNDTEGLNNANAKLQKMELSLGNVIDDRVEGAAQKIYNKYSPLREGKNLSRKIR